MHDRGSVDEFANTILNAIDLQIVDVPGGYQAQEGACHSEDCSYSRIIWRISPALMSTCSVLAYIANRITRSACRR